MDDMKNKFLKLIIVLVVFTLGSIALTGCSSTKESSNMEDKDYIVVGLDDTFVPMGFKDNKGEIVGFDVDLAKEVGKRIDKDVKFQPIDWSMKETELNSGNIDLIWNGYTITDERKEKVSFTNPYLANRQVIITLSNSNINTKDDLKDKKVAAQNGSSSVDAINKEPKLVKEFNGGKPILFETNNDAFMDLEAGRVDAIVADEILARYYIKQRGSEKYNVIQDDFGKEEYGIGVRKQDKELVENINKALEDMKKDGASAKISEKWFGENILK
jgi:polar amino acid transport system substrate-binding protein